MRAAIKYLLLFILMLLPFGVQSQVTDEIYHERLFYTAKLWGHVKYFHSAMAGYMVDWDDVLLNSLDDIRNAPDNESFNQALLDMIHEAGPMETGSTLLPDFPDSLNNNNDTSWFYASKLSEDVSAALDTIRVRFRPQNNRYVSEQWNNGPPAFLVDSKYESVEGLPDENMRILALFRYWNIIHYFFPYKYIMDQDWDETLAEFIPKIVEAEDALTYHLTFKKLTTRINDSHAFFSSPVFNAWQGFAFPPFLARYIENQMVVTQVLPEVDIAPGDVIKRIDNEEIDELRGRLRKYAHGSNDEIIERTINDFILWGQGGEFSITVSDGSTERTLNLNRNSSNFNLLNFDDSPVWSETFSDDGCHFGIVDMGRLEVNQVASMFNDLWNTDAIVFDIRHYPRGTLWTIVNYLYRSSINNANFTQPDSNFPGRLVWVYSNIGEGTSSPYSGKVIILFDERTQSHAEYTVMGLERYHSSIKIGSTTAAADGNIAQISLPGQIRTAATFLGVYYPDYTPTQRIGIIPDIEVRPTIQGIRNLQDEVMNHALQCDVLMHTSDPDERGSISVYPNPVHGEINYELSTEFPGAFSIDIYDILGRKVLSVNQSTSSGTIDVSGLANGVYFIQASFFDITQTGKFVKVD